MEQTDTKQEPQEQQAAASPRPWITPTFERVPLNDALSGGLGAYDGVYMGS